MMVHAVLTAARRLIGLTSPELGRLPCDGRGYFERHHAARPAVATPARDDPSRARARRSWPPSLPRR